MGNEIAKTVPGTTRKASLEKIRLYEVRHYERTICLNEERLYGQPDPRVM